MHHLGSTIMSFLLSPINWIIVLLIAGYFLQKTRLKKLCRIMALCIFILFSNEWFLSWYAKKWQPEPVTIAKDVAYSCGIVAGGFASPDFNEKGYFNATADRFIQAVKLFKQGKITHILISGGNGKVEKKNFREGAWVKSELAAMEIPDSVVFVEDRSNNTFDNAVHAKEIVTSRQLKSPYLLITSAHHMPRAALLFANAGVPVIPYPCNYIAGRGNHGFSLIPRFSALIIWEYYLKETAAYFWYKLK